MQITIDNKQYYKFLGKDIDMISLIKLHVENGKVTRHEDWYTLRQFGSIIYSIVRLEAVLIFHGVFFAGGIRSLLGAERRRKFRCLGESWRLCEVELCWLLML